MALAAQEQSIEAGAAPAPVAAPRPARRPPTALIVVAIVAVALIALGLEQWSFGRSHVVSDDAQVEGHIIPVLPRVSGYVAEVRVSENQTVHAGDVERYRSLAASGVVSRQQLDNAEAAASVAAAQLRGARDQVAAAAAAVRNADSKVTAARAARDQAALQLSYTQLVAPRDGVVSKKSVEVGQLVQPGQPLMSVVPLDDIWVVANLKETEIREIRPGRRAEIEVDSYPGRRFQGHVESLSPATGAKFSLLPPDNATGNFTKVVQRIPVRIRLDGPPDPQHPLRPGMSVKAIVTTR